MKMSNVLSRTQLAQYQKENMDPALELIGTNITKYSKRNQIAARMLGFNSYESLVFNKDLYDHVPDHDEMLVGLHPKHPGFLVALTHDSVTVIDLYGQIAFRHIPKHELTISSLDHKYFDDMRDKDNANKAKMETPIAPDHFDLGFDGVRSFHVGAHRGAHRKISFEWVMHNGITFPLDIICRTRLTSKPHKGSIEFKRTISVHVSNPTMEGVHGGWDACSVVSLAKKNQLPYLNDYEILWEVLHELKDSTPWQSRTALVAEHFDCVRMAYAFLDAQKVTNTIRKHNFYNRLHLKADIERWAGRYVSSADVDMAIKFHPLLKGDHSNVNISVKYVMPCLSRLKGVHEAFTHDYKFMHDQFSDYGKMEKDGQVVAFEPEWFMSQSEAARAG